MVYQFVLCTFVCNSKSHYNPIVACSAYDSDIFYSWEGKGNVWDFQSTRHAMTTANCYLHSLRINLSVNLLWARWTVSFPASLTKRPERNLTLFTFSLELCHIRGIPSFNHAIKEFINPLVQQASRSLYFYFTVSLVIPISETQKTTLFGSHKKNTNRCLDKCDHIVACETRYSSKYELREHKIPLRSIFCLL